MATLDTANEGITFGEAWKAGQSAAHTIKSVATEVAVRGLSMATVFPYGYVATRRNPQDAVTSTENITTAQIGSAFIGLVLSVFIGGIYFDAHPVTQPFKVATVISATLALPCAISITTGVATDYKTAKRKITKSTFIKNAAKAEIPGSAALKRFLHRDKRLEQ